jgi:peptidyl-prolyl cis-trans isomerase B (cyclophilin B)
VSTERSQAGQVYTEEFCLVRGEALLHLGVLWTNATSRAYVDAFLETFVALSPSASEAARPEDASADALVPAPMGLSFLTMSADELASYSAVLRTNQGDINLELWPDVAPEHVRNFFDLCYTGFYDGTKFHRVIPGFMIQGGDPNDDGTGSGPRRLKAEFSDRKHVPGVLSMERSRDPNSASCQFFIMHGSSTQLDGQYTCFGKVISGFDVIDKIVNAKRNSQDKPLEPQTIVNALVVGTSK